MNQDEERQQSRCSTCDGYGWEIGHEDECYEGNGCGCSGVQVPCSTCGGEQT